LLPTQEKKSQPDTLLTHPITHIGNQKFHIPLASPKEIFFGFVECMLQYLFG
jgi:hypothetical protein